MKDTPAHIERLYREMLMRRSGAERLRQGAAMFETAKKLVRASLGDAEGLDRSAEMRVKLFLRIYGQDFDPQTRERIAARLRRGTDNPRLR
jgi:hypothetical protein